MKRNFLALLMLALSIPMLAQTWSKDLEKAAKKGDVTAQLAVGNAYFNGDGVNADKEKAAQWYSKAAFANSAEGKEKLCSFHSKELEALAKKGDVTAQLAVGDFYFKGEGVNADKAVAAKWYYMATLANSAEGKAKLYSFYSKELEKLAKNDTEALYQLGCHFFDGNGVAKDVKKGLKYLNKARKNNHPKAFEKMGSTYTREFFVMAKDIAYYEGNCEGIYYLGLCILNGIGCTADADIAAELFEAAMKAGHKKSAEMFYKIYSDALLEKSRKSKNFGTDFGYVNADGYQCLIDLNAKKILMTAPSDSSFVADNFEFKFGNGTFFKGKLKVVKDGPDRRAPYASILLLSGYVVIENDTLTIADPIYDKPEYKKLHYAPKEINEVVKEDTISFYYHNDKINFDVKNWTKTTTIHRWVDSDLKPIEDYTKITYHSGKSWISTSSFYAGCNFYLETDEGIWIKSIDDYDRKYEIGRCDFFNTVTGEQEEQKYYRFNEFPKTIIDGLRSFNKEKAQKIFASTGGRLMNFKSDKHYPDYPSDVENFYYGMNKEQYDVYAEKIAQKEALERAKEYIKEVEKKYGSTQANLLRNKSNILNPKKEPTYLIKGLHIDVVKSFMKEKFGNTHVLEHSHTYDNGTSIYYIKLYWYTKDYGGKIWFKNNYITNWVEY